MSYVALWQPLKYLRTDFRFCFTRGIYLPKRNLSTTRPKVIDNLAGLSQASSLMQQGRDKRQLILAADRASS